MNNVPDDDSAPTQEDCCNSGCTPCVFDIYREKLEGKTKKAERSEHWRHDLLSETKFKPFILLVKQDFGECFGRIIFQPLLPDTKTTVEQNCDVERVPVDGFLPYCPGQHFTMKSWKVSLEDIQEIRTLEKFEDQYSSSKIESSINSVEDVSGQDEENCFKEHLLTSRMGVEEDLRITRKVLVNQTNSGIMTKVENSRKDVNLIDENNILTPGNDVLDNKKRDFITRDYTPITLAKKSKDCCFELIVKYYNDGEMSKYLKSLKIGDIVQFRGPYGDFKYKSNKNHILAICIGTGIAPIYAVIKSILDDEDDETVIKLLYGCKDSNSILLREELQEMARFWNFHSQVFLTSGSLEMKFGENFQTGRIQKNDVYDYLKQKQLVLVCGSEAFNNEIVGYLREFKDWEVEYYVF